MKKDKQLSPLEAEMLSGLSALRDVLNSGEAIEKRFTVRTVTLDLEPKSYEAADVKLVRSHLGASQALFAKFLGVSVKTLRSWEQGTRPVPSIACRYLDDIVAYPVLWQDRIRTATNPGCRG